MELLLLEESLKTTEITTATGEEPSPEAAQPHAGTLGDKVYWMEDSGAHKGPQGGLPKLLP